MNKFSFGERYRLELHWKGVLYEQPGLCKLIGAYFTGPVLNEAQRIADNDNILLDFFEQYYLVVSSVYIARLQWGQVVYEPNGIVSLYDAIITHERELNRAPKLNNNDYLVINTKGHEAETHRFNPVYKTYVVNNDTQLYKFGPGGV